MVRLEPFPWTFLAKSLNLCIPVLVRLVYFPKSTAPVCTQSLSPFLCLIHATITLDALFPIAEYNPLIHASFFALLSLSVSIDQDNSKKTCFSTCTITIGMGESILSYEDQGRNLI